MGLGDATRAYLARRADFQQARNSLLSSQATDGAERHLLEKVSLRVDRSDAMYVPGQAAHYLTVGLSAARCIRRALASRGDRCVNAILDFPCGHGRVLRYLRVMFPDAAIMGAEIDPAALAFCRRVFHIDTLPSQPDIASLTIPRNFDVIWCGSLLTHLDQHAAAALLRLFRASLAQHGVCVVTAHGTWSADWIRSRTVTYGLSPLEQAAVVRGFDHTGYGYGSLEDSPGYGISLVTRERMTALSAAAGGWREVFYQERGWDDHQDVYALAAA